MTELYANSGDSDHTLQNAASDLVCTVCQLPFLGFPDYNGLMEGWRHMSKCTFSDSGLHI